MSGQQAAEQRQTVDLPVRIWGMSAQGRPFSQHVRAQNISSEGALLNNVESELKVGDVIGVQFEDKKARCSVIWALNTGTIKKNQVGIRLVTDQECPWRDQLPEGATDAVISASNRRRYHRHKISLPIEIRDETGASALADQRDRCQRQWMLYRDDDADADRHGFANRYLDRFGPDYSLGNRAHMRSRRGQWN